MYWLPRNLILDKINNFIIKDCDVVTKHHWLQKDKKLETVDRPHQQVGRSIITSVAITLLNRPFP